MSTSRFQVLHFGSDLQNASVKLRDKVLRAPLGLHFTKEDLEQESQEYHLAMISELPGGSTQVDAILLLKKTDSPDVIKMRQVATRPELQGKGIGTILVSRSEEYARSLGYRTMSLHARETAVPFYLKLGYRITSERFTEVSIPHFAMEKSLIS